MEKKKLLLYLSVGRQRQTQGTTTKTKQTEKHGHLEKQLNLAQILLQCNIIWQNGVLADQTHASGHY